MSNPLESFLSLEEAPFAGDPLAFDQNVGDAFDLPIASEEPEFETEAAFALLDDCAGRFAIDPDLGVISLADDGLLEREKGQIHTARIRVRELSGESYEMTLKLRISGHVPQMVTGEPEFELAPAPAPQPAPLIRARNWIDFPPEAEDEPFGALAYPVAAPPEISGIDVAFWETPPAPSAANADWSL